MKRKKRRQSDAIDCNSSDNDSKSQFLCRLEFGSLPEPDLITYDDEVIFYFIIGYYGLF